MAFNGSGLFVRLYNWVNDAANSINIKADRMDAEMDGFASGLSNCLTRDGQGKPSAAIDWNSQNLSNVNALSANSASVAGTASLAGAVNFGATFSLASAATVSIGAAAAYSGTITGVVTITAFDNVVAGIIREVTFAAALTLTHNATSLILPGAANITTAAGDCATFLSLGAGNWRCIKYMRAGGLGSAVTAVRNLTGNVNATTPLTKFDLSCDFLTLRNASGATITLYGPHTRTCDLGSAQAASAANGRDQSAAFPANSWIHTYFISDGATLATLASTTAPASFTGASLPAGYTHWCYATTIRWNGAGNIVPVVCRGSTVAYNAYVNIASGAPGSGVETLLSTSSVAPDNAVSIFLNSYASLVANATGANAARISLRHTSGANYAFFSIHTNTANGTAISTSFVQIPNVAQRIYYFWAEDTANTTSRSIEINVSAYTVANGDA